MSQSLSQKTVIESALALCPYPTAKIPAKWTICKQKSEAVEGGDKEGAEGRLEGPGGEAIFPWRAGTRMPDGRRRGEMDNLKGLKRKIGREMWKGRGLAKQNGGAVRIGHEWEFSDEEWAQKTPRSIDCLVLLGKCENEGKNWDGNKMRWFIPKNLIANRAEFNCLGILVWIWDRKINLLKILSMIVLSF